MQKTPKSLRLQIGLFGRRNVGKSSVLNMFTRQNTSIVSEIAGTTTDPVEKAMELLPVGPVLFIDTAGIDDTGALGEKRIERTKIVFNRTDLAVIICGENGWSDFEESIKQEFILRETPTIVVFNKTDLYEPDPQTVKMLTSSGIKVVKTCAVNREGILDLREAIIRSAPDEFIIQPTIIGDLLGKDDFAVLVTPIDKEAPKGRLILPQVQTIRNILDHDSYCIVVKEPELKQVIENQKKKPYIVVTDSQAFAEVSADTPDDILLTGFSVLFARVKGDLMEMVKGATAIEDLEDGDKVLICEACTHHPIEDDIGTVKIPKWLRNYTGAEIEFDHLSGHDFPANLEQYKLVIHCGACVHNRREVLSRIALCRHHGVPITNYGLSIAYTLGIFERALKPFPKVLAAYHASLKKDNT